MRANSEPSSDACAAPQAQLAQGLEATHSITLALSTLKMFHFGYLAAITPGVIKAPGLSGNMATKWCKRRDGDTARSVPCQISGARFCSRVLTASRSPWSPVSGPISLLLSPDRVSCVSGAPPSQWPSEPCGRIMTRAAVRASIVDTK